MSQENVELVRRGHKAFRDSGEEAIFEYLHADIDMTPVDELLDAETRSTATTAFAASFSCCAKPSATSDGNRRRSWIRATTSSSPRASSLRGAAAPRWKR